MHEVPRSTLPRILRHEQTSSTLFHHHTHRNGRTILVVFCQDLAWYTDANCSTFLGIFCACSSFIESRIDLVNVLPVSFMLFDRNYEHRGALSDMYNNDTDARVGTSRILSRLTFVHDFRNTSHDILHCPPSLSMHAREAGSGGSH